jgi:hypothetical protein
MDRWLPFAYQYGLGGLIFVIGVAMLLRAGALRLRRPEDRRLLLAMVAGLLGFMTIHAVWIELAG